MEFLIAVVVGGLICVVGQLLIDFTKLTPAAAGIGAAVFFGYIAALCAKPSDKG